MIPIRLLLPLVVLAAVVGGCTPVRTDGLPSAEVAAFETYAWRQGMDLDETMPGVANGESLFAEIRAAADQALAAKGLRLVAPTDAQLLAEIRVAIEEETQRNDPEYAYYTVERFEEGRIALEFADARDDTLVWRGIGSTRLRVVAKGIGLYDVQFVQTEEQRDWPVTKMVDAIVARYPK
ncbi:MAG: DUF4136 domain-containing protein [Phycisphaerales bacterium]|nr:DUF4136 domain-containing protein [Phycisphaerales bacterium]